MANELPDFAWAVPAEKEADLRDRSGASKRRGIMPRDDAVIVEIQKQLPTVSQGMRFLTAATVDTMCYSSDQELIKQLVSTGQLHSKNATGKKNHGMGKPEAHMALCVLKCLASCPQVAQQSKKVITEMLGTFATAQMAGFAIRALKRKKCYDQKYTNLLIKWGHQHATIMEAMVQAGGTVRGGQAPASSLERAIPSRFDSEL